MAYKLKHRYLVFKVLSPVGLSPEEIKKAVTDSTIELYGLYGLSKTAPEILEYDEKTSTGIARCNRGQQIALRSSMTVITAIGGSPVTFFVLGVSGTLKALRARTKKEWPPHEVFFRIFKPTQ